MKRILFSIAVAFCGACVHAPTLKAQAEPTKPHLVGYDIYGTDRLTVEEAKQILGADLDICSDFYVQQKMDKYSECQPKLIAKLQEKFHFAYLDLSFIGYYEQGDQPFYGTFDVVEKKDAKKRLHFKKRPTSTYDDPDGLLKAWDEYLAKGFELTARGEIQSGEFSCPAFHCIFGHDHPALKPYEKVFVEGAAKHKERLIEILRNDKNDQHRGTAPFVLAYIKDGVELVNVLKDHLLDESAFVRNNVTRVFFDISRKHQELSLPVDKFITLLDFPTTTDRNKAGYSLLFVIANPKLREKYHEKIMAEVIPIYLKMLRLNQPNNHNPAFDGLKLFSGQNFGERDYQAWEDWYQRSRAQ